MTQSVNRLDARFAKLKAANKKALITFISAGYPDLETFPQILAGQARAGADIIEVGMPFSDPMADGPAIQEANVQALSAGITTTKILAMVKAFRQTDTETPILLMGYYNPVLSYGLERFLDDARDAGVDGFILPDLPPEEDAEFRLLAEARNLRLIRFVTPTTDPKRLTTILEGANGFLYYVSITGITGRREASAEALHAHIAEIKAKTDLPLCVGFGIKEPDQARSIAALGDGVIVGSAITQTIKANCDSSGKAKPGLVEKTLSFISSLAAAVHA